MTHRTDDPGVDDAHDNDAHDHEHDTRAYDTHEHVPDERPARADAPAGEQVNVNAAGGRTAYVERTDPLVTLRRVVGLIFGVLIALIALRILLLALGANEGNALVDAIYGISEPLVAPFRGVFSFDEVRPTGNSVLDIAALVALVGWSLIALLVLAILRIPARD